MAEYHENLDNLLKHIEDKAISKADEEASRRLQKAQDRAVKLVQDAELKARSIVEKAEQQVALKEENGRKNLEQAARDFLLLVRKSVTDQLSDLIRQALTKTLSEDFLATALSSLLPKLLEQNPAGVEVELPKSEQDALVDGIMALLAEEAKKGVELRPVAGVRTGFRLVLKEQDVHIDLADDALVEMISRLVNADVAAALVGGSNKAGA